MDCQIVQEGARLIARCPEETFADLLRSWPHWEMEILLMLVSDGILGALAWPFARRWWSRHHDHTTCDPKEG